MLATAIAIMQYNSCIILFFDVKAAFFIPDIYFVILP